MTDGNAENDDAKETERERRLKKATEREDLDADALERVHEDARFTVEQTLQSFSDLSGKAFRLIRLNSIVLTILVAIASQTTVRRFVNVASVASLLLFIWSAVFALFAYLATTFNRGFDANILGKPAKYRLREAEYLTWTLSRAYPKWIADGVEKVNQKERWIRRSLVAFIAGITTLIVGILFTFY